MKKTECITFRTTKEVKDTLAQLAVPKKWSVSLLVDVYGKLEIQKKGAKSA